MAPLPPRPRSLVPVNQRETVYFAGVQRGRAEILALVAAIDPLYSVNGVSPADTCFFCGCDGRHAEDCLWLRAQQAASEER